MGKTATPDSNALEMLEGSATKRENKGLEIGRSEGGCRGRGLRHHITRLRRGLLITKRRKTKETSIKPYQILINLSIRSSVSRPLDVGSIFFLLGILLHSCFTLTFLH